MNVFDYPAAFDLIPAIISAAIFRLDSDEDREFMVSLYLTYNKQLLAYALRFSRHKEDAEDAVQNAFLTLIPKASMLRKMEERRLKSYVFVSVKNAALLLMRRECQFMQSETTDRIDEEAYAEEPLYPYTAEKLRAAILQLDQRDQALLQMKYFQELKDSEIAAQFQVKENSVRMMVKRARQRLTRKLKEGGQADE